MNFVYECLCARCHPTDAPEQCSKCGEEVRWGWRDGVHGCWHRGNVDHAVIHGHRHTQADEDREQAALDEVRYDEPPVPFLTKALVAHTSPLARRLFLEAGRAPESYTIRERYAKKLNAEGEEEAEPIPAPEVMAEPCEKTSKWVPGGAKQIWNLAEKNGWTIVRATRSRGPRVHASHGTLLGISDFFQLKMRLDTEDRSAVASWTDGKFEFAYNCTIHRDTKTITADKANSDGLKVWIKGEFI